MKTNSSCCCSSSSSSNNESQLQKSIELAKAVVVVNHNTPPPPLSNGVDENRPKPIPAPPMNDECRVYCKKVLHDLLGEYDLLNHVHERSDDSVVSSCCRSVSSCLNDSYFDSSKWPKYITLCGIGSLLSEKSARRTFPDLINFRKAIVKNYVRCFNLVAISSLRFGDLEKRKIASVAAVSHLDLENETFEKFVKLQNKNDNSIDMYCSVFEIPLTEEVWCAYMTREHRYEFKFVTIELDQEIDNNGSYKKTCSCCGDNCKCTELSSCGCKALMCCQYTDDLYRMERCSSYENEYEERVAQHFDGRLWYHTKHVQMEKHIHNGEIPIKPIPKYLELCFNAALEMGPEVFDNFIKTSVMADGITLLEEYLEKEEPELYAKYISNRHDPQIL